PTEGDDLFGGGLVAGVGHNIELGWGIISHANGDRNSVGLKYRAIHNKDTGFNLAFGGQFYTRGGGGRDSPNQDGLGYAVASFPYPYGTVNFGGMWLPDDTQNSTRDIGGFGSINYFLYPDIEFYYEVTQISRINGELFHSFGLNYRPSDKTPLWIHIGGLSGEFDPSQGTDTVITAGLTIGYNESFIYKKEEGGS
ncbi:MAG: hypothetical protein ACREJQ_05960, partial [bacterium]